VARWFARHPKAREWAWFVALWLGGLMAAVALATPIKLIIKSMQ
jgi:hypothetical protein